MLTINFNQKSINDLLKELKGKEKDVLEMVKGEVEDALLKIESEAVKKVPVDTGDLKNSIQSKPIKQTKNKVEGTVLVGKNYAPYVEFGTGTEVVVPQELQNFAKQFKANPKIREVNLPAQPFFYPEFFRQRIELPKQIEKTLQTILKRK
jgi:HK97 gp10 family phage protein